MDILWRERSACRDLDPALFETVGNNRVTPEAFAACSSCPVRAECAADAVESKDVWTVRVGLTPAQRGCKTPREIVETKLVAPTLPKSVAQRVADHRAREKASREGPRIPTSREWRHGMMATLWYAGWGSVRIAKELGMDDRDVRRRTSKLDPALRSSGPPPAERCAHGHLWSENDVRNARGDRRCRQCGRDVDARRRAARRRAPRKRARMTVCGKGLHAFTPANTSIRKDGTRQCVLCQNRRSRNARKAARDRAREDAPPTTTTGDGNEPRRGIVQRQDDARARGEELPRDEGA